MTRFDGDDPRFWEAPVVVHGGVADVGAEIDDRAWRRVVEGVVLAHEHLVERRPVRRALADHLRAVDGIGHDHRLSECEPAVTDRRRGARPRPPLDDLVEATTSASNE
ncbi:MAG: hypothetical protein WKF58_02515 [Ilumatobacteraceae bacterium]